MGIRGALIVAFLLTSPLPSQAGFYDGNELHKQCKTFRDFVMGYVAGATDKAQIDQNAVLSAWLDIVDPKAFDATAKINEKVGAASRSVSDYCMPQGVKLSQVLDVYCKYLRDKPESRHLAAAVLFNHAMTRAWPCPK